MKTIYTLYNTHTDTSAYVYSTLTGARIAQRNRNRLLGFKQRVERKIFDDNERERYYDTTHTLVEWTYRIVYTVVNDSEYARLFSSV